MIIRWVNSLAGRLTLFICLAIMLAQVIGVLAFVQQQERNNAQQISEDFVRQLVGLVDLFNNVPELDRRAYLDTARQRGIQFWASMEPAVSTANFPLPAEAPELPLNWRAIDSADKRIAWFADGSSLFQRYRMVPQRGPLRPNDPPGPPGPDGFVPNERNGFDNVAPELRPPNVTHFPGRRLGAPVRGLIDVNGGPPPPGMVPMVRWRASVQLQNGQWINAEQMYQGGLPPWLRTVLAQNAVMLALMLAFIIPVVFFTTKRLKLLANAADKVGRGEDTEPLPESGTTELRQLTAAFNNMSLRLRRFVIGRTQMLAGISHDLRTPITALRLRADLVDDEENRDRMLALIDDMQHLTEATLTLAKDESYTEKSDRVDVSSLIEGICDDLVDAGIDATAEVERGVILSCRPHSLRRAIRNLAENGAKYGARARIHMNGDARNVRIIIDDDGPGIPEAEMEKAFQPFVRLEGSRNRGTGGSGLGLAICKSIILNHGGEIALSNRPEGGLRAVLTLPKADGE